MPEWYPDEDPRLTLRKWVVARRGDGWSFHRIARERGLPKSNVERWVRWAEEGRELTDRKRGRGAGGRGGAPGGGGGSVSAIVRRRALNEPLPRPRRKHAYVRFERDHSNSMWQTDWKQLDGGAWLTAYLDDHSRFVPGAVV